VAFHVIICLTVNRGIINAKHFVVFIVLMQRTCNIFHQCTDIFDNPRHMRRHYGRLPDRLSSSTDSRPCTERLCHLKTSFYDSELVPLDLFSSLWVSVGALPIFAQNLMIVRISRRLATDIFTYF
jgi:hypothetical protein